jgi:hypothetical protein
MKEIISNDYLGQYKDIKDGQELKNHEIFSKWKYAYSSMTTFQRRIKPLSEKGD